MIDCGAAPGSWSQVAVTKTNANSKSSYLNFDVFKLKIHSYYACFIFPSDTEVPTGKVIGIDKITVAPIEGAIFLCPYDFTSEIAQLMIIKELNGYKADVVLSDMAPNATGMKRMDHEYLIEMAYSVLR